MSRETKLLQYADDTVLFLNGDRRSLESSISLLHNFRRASGLKINLQKSHLFPLGPFVTNHPTFVSYLNLSLNLGPIKFLGITFTHNGDDLYRLNYVTKLSRLKNMLNVWSNRVLTPIGRNIIVKSFALLQLVYLFQVLPDPPDTFINEVQTTSFDFIWSKNPDKVRRRTMYNDYSNSGLKITHVRTFMYALKISWVKRYLGSDNGIWKIFFDYYLTFFGKSFIFQCNFASKDIKSVNNMFIRQVCLAWSCLNFHTPVSNYGNQVLWNNHFIKVDGKIVYNDKLHKAGVLYVKDLFDENDSLISYVEFCNTFSITQYPFTLFSDYWLQFQPSGKGIP